jgi:predicted PurR-regulated permease PerM
LVELGAVMETHQKLHELDTESVPASEDDRVHLHTPVDVRSASLAVLAVLAALFALHWAKEVLVPILFGTMLSYALAPLVDRLERSRIPRVAAAFLVVTLFGTAIAWGAWRLSDQASAFVDTLPQVAQKLRQLTESTSGSTSTIAKVQAAATEIAAAGDAGASAAAPQSNVRSGGPHIETPRQRATGAAAVPRDGSTHVVIETPKFDIRGFLLSGTLGVLVFLGQLTIAFFVGLFLLTSGSAFRRKMVKLAGPKLSQKKITIETLNEINGQIQRYLLVQIAISALVGVATWLAFSLFGVNQAPVWGVVAGVTNLIPYVGAILLAVGSFAMGLVQFDSMALALGIGATSLVIHIVVGNLLTPWWMGRASRMSTFVVFVCVIAFGWLWGIAGLLLGVPILMVLKSICDRVEDLKPIGELLGD